MVIVGEVHLPVMEDTHNFTPSGKLRLFQKEFIDCVKSNKADVIQLIAPTGAGKTLCFEYLLHEGNKVLLIYPTNALIQSQMDRFKKKGFNPIYISSKILSKKEYERAQELYGLIKRYDIILTNPDIFQAIIGGMYVNPEENLEQSFHLFEYVIYDEFHAYREFELSGILTQIALFQNMSSCKVILSSATPKEEIIELLNLVRIGKDRHAPIIDNIFATPCSMEEGEIIRYQTKVEFHQGKILDNIKAIADVLHKIIGELKPGSPQILFIFDTVKDSNLFFTRLFKEYPEIYEYAEKDNGYDTNQIGDTPNFTKPILISTNKSEVGLDYPIKMLFMEDGFSIDSFVQRFGRAARHEPANCYIYTKKEANPIFPDEIIAYPTFLEKMSFITGEYNIQTKSVRTLFTFRQAIAIEKYVRRKDDLRAYFAVDTGYSYKLWLNFFILLNKYNNDGLSNPNLKRLKLLIDDIKDACKSLRGRSLRYPVIYTRGHEIRQTMYDMLSVLNRVSAVVERTNEGFIIREIESEETGPFISAIKLPYFPDLMDYQKRREQFNEKIETIAKKAVDVFPEKQQGFLLACIRSLYHSIEPDRIMMPDEIILWNRKVISLSQDAMDDN
ncbi:MAG: type I-D CRISPR-associated helicase Cas3' [Candidatus Methanoperedens sp.]|nr:type I-D CRISPR-associated helicase Cas3' [Candidatus Methanoperedens sp.]